MNTVDYRPATKADRQAADQYTADPLIERFKQIFDLLDNGQSEKLAFGSMVEEFAEGAERLRELQALN